jgi:hypothetical protein
MTVLLTTKVILQWAKAMMIGCDISPSLMITEKTLRRGIPGVRCAAGLSAVGNFTRKVRKIYGDMGRDGCP